MKARYLKKPTTCATCGSVSKTPKTGVHYCNTCIEAFFAKAHFTPVTPPASMVEVVPCTCDLCMRRSKRSASQLKAGSKCICQRRRRIDTEHSINARAMLGRSANQSAIQKLAYNLKRGGLTCCVAGCDSPRPETGRSGKWKCAKCNVATFASVGLRVLNPDQFNSSGKSVAVQCVECGRIFNRCASDSAKGARCKCVRVGFWKEPTLRRLSLEKLLRPYWIYLKDYGRGIVKVGVGTSSRVNVLKLTHPLLLSIQAPLIACVRLEANVLSKWKSVRVRAGSGRARTTECLSAGHAEVSQYMLSHPFITDPSAATKLAEAIVTPCPPPSIPLSTSPRSDDVTSPQSPIGSPDEGNGSGS